MSWKSAKCFALLAATRAVKAREMMESFMIVARKVALALKKVLLGRMKTRYQAYIGRMDYEGRW